MSEETENKLLETPKESSHLAGLTEDEINFVKFAVKINIDYTTKLVYTQK